MHAFLTGAGLLALALSAAEACAQQGGAEGASAGRTGRFELKRMNTARGTPDETTMTQLRMERYFDGPVTMLRFDLPLPDEKTGFAGDPFEPRLGDVKARLRFRDLKSDSLSFPTFVEAIFPTADPKSLGKGKYQLSAGIRMIAPLRLPFGDATAHRSNFEVEVQQTNSVAGDPIAKEVSNTRLEISVFDLWREKYIFKLKLKPSIDWTLDGKSGGIVEAEAGRYIGGNWRAWVMIGQRAWGPSNIANTYKTRVELGLNYTY